jgi:hypothetical protein
MIRRLLISAFAVIVLAHALGAAALAFDDDSACHGCCKTKRSEEVRSNLDKICCLMNCNEPAEKQSSAPADQLTTERVNKRCSTATIVLTSEFTTQLAQSSYSSYKRAPRSIPIYLKTGNLLI